MSNEEELIKTKKKNMNIAIAAEITPAKTLIPVIEKLKKLNSENKLKWNLNKIIGLYHGEGAKKLLKPYCEELISIGEGRGKTKHKTGELVYLISKDIIKAFNGLKGKNIDLLITVGNAGDVRKSIVAANILRIPILHIEQDIYNPIEMISHANLITVPSKKYLKLLKDKYKIKNVLNIGGYPMAKYVEDNIKTKNLKDKNEIFKEYKINNFILVVLGGDLKDKDIPKLIQTLEKLDKNILIAPYRFNKEIVESYIVSPLIKVLNQYVDLLSFINAADTLIYAAGMGMTIEAGVINTPSLKIEGFHKTHGSVDLANLLEIPIVKISEIPKNINSLNSLKSEDLIKNSEIAINNLVDIINDFDFSLKKSGLKSTKFIWNSRKEFR